MTARKTHSTVDLVRICLALALAPLIPLIYVAVFASSKSASLSEWTTSPDALQTLMVLLPRGYALFAIFGIPLFFLVRHRGPIAFALAGAAVASSPLISMALFQIFTSAESPDIGWGAVFLGPIEHFGLYLFRWKSILAMGGLGGLLCWFVAFFPELRGDVASEAGSKSAD